MRHQLIQERLSIVTRSFVFDQLGQAAVKLQYDGILSSLLRTGHRHAFTWRVKRKDDAQRELEEEAWIGDAVLTLFAREWLLKNPSGYQGRREEAFRNLTSNQFLSCIGHPTSVEAAIGKIYNEQGLQASFDFIEGKILPLFKKQQNNRNKRGSQS